jgi:rhamnosyltransferase subunit B
VAASSAFILDPGIWNRNSVAKTLMKHWLPWTQAYYEAIVGLHRPGETILFGPARFYPARIAQEKLGAPYVSGLIAPARMGSHLDPAHPARPFPSWTNPFVRSRAGLRLVQGLRPFVRGRQISGSSRAILDEMGRVRRSAGLPEQWPAPATLQSKLNLCFWPSWFSPRQKDWPATARTGGFPFYSKPAVRASSTSSRLIVFTRGSVASHQRPFFEAAVECCRRLGRPGVLVTPHEADIPPGLPPDVTHLHSAPFGELFAKSAAVVHHGGVGTIAHALAAGIPQIAIPIVGEQFDLGYRMERLGVGRMLTRVPVGAGSLSRALGSVLRSHRIRRNCTHLRDQVDTEAGSSLPAQWIEEVADESLSKVRRSVAI